MDGKQPEGWSVPVYGAVAKPILIAGVTPGFLACVFLGTLMGFFVQWRALALGLVIYGAGAALTRWEPRWWAMLRRYRRYHVRYEA